MRKIKKMHTIESVFYKKAVLISFIWLSISISGTLFADTYYFHTDHLDTTQVITDTNKVIVWGSDHEPFGVTNITVNNITNNLRFPGQYFDIETGLHYNLTRDYNSLVGRYMQSDSIGLAGGLNTYLYANANPVKYIDPTGEAAQVCLIPGLCPAIVQVCRAAATRIAQLLALGYIVETIDCDGNNSCSTDETDEDDDRCDRQYYDIDIPTCRGVSRNRGKTAGARCFASAAERYAACLAGRPMPPLDTYNN